MNILMKVYKFHFVHVIEWKQWVMQLKSTHTRVKREWERMMGKGCGREWWLILLCFSSNENFLFGWFSLPPIRCYGLVSLHLMGLGHWLICLWRFIIYSALVTCEFFSFKLDCIMLNCLVFSCSINFFFSIHTMVDLELFCILFFSTWISLCSLVHSCHLQVVFYSLYHAKLLFCNWICIFQVIIPIWFYSYHQNFMRPF